MTFASPEMTALFERELALPGVRFIADPAKVHYRALGFGRASVRRVWLHPRVWRRYAALLARGRRPRPPEGDTLQLGGDAVLCPDGRVAWRYASTGPDDRPSADEVVLAARSIREQVVRDRS